MALTPIPTIGPVPMTIHAALLDRVAIALSALCAVHCLALPVALTLIPIVGGTFFLSDEFFHRFLLLFVLPTSVAALLMGYRSHGSRAIPIFGMIGLVWLSLVAYFGHETFGDRGERIATVLGSQWMAIGHYVNYRRLHRASRSITGAPD